MIKKPMITSAQLLLMALGSALIFPYTFMPILTTPPANQDVWVVLLMSFAYILVFNTPILILMNRFRGIQVHEMVETTMGKFLGKILLIPLILFFLYCFIACMLITIQFINIYISPSTPPWALLILMLIPISYASYKGAGTIGRLATIIVSFVLFTVVIFFLMGIEKMDPTVLQPMLADSKFSDLNMGAFYTGARYSEILIFFVFSFYLKKEASINRTYLLTLLVFAVSFLAILLPILFVLGPDLAEHEWNPYYVYTRQVGLFGFLERVQSINTLAWFPASILKLAIYNYMASHVLSGMLSAKTHRTFVIPLSVLAFIVCMLPFINTTDTVLMLRSDHVFPWVIIPVIFVVPLIIALVYWMRHKKIDPIIKQRQEAKPAEE